LLDDNKIIVNDNSGEYQKLQKSNYCIEYITSYEEDTLGSIIDTLSPSGFPPFLLLVCLFFLEPPVSVEASS
jgi:hypothetical protein